MLLFINGREDFNRILAVRVLWAGRADSVLLAPGGISVFGIRLLEMWRWVRGLMMACLRKLPLCMAAQHLAAWRHAPVGAGGSGTTHAPAGDPGDQPGLPDAPAPTPSSTPLLAAASTQRAACWYRADRLPELFHRRADRP